MNFDLIIQRIEVCRDSNIHVYLTEDLTHTDI